MLSKNARYSTSELAVMLGTDEQTVKNEVEEMKKNGLIRGCKAVIDWEKLDTGAVSAIIKLKQRRNIRTRLKRYNFGAFRIIGGGRR